jgi:hypothetical protein
MGDFQMTEKLIQYMVGKAEGFEWYVNYMRFLQGGGCYTRLDTFEFGKDFFKSMYYPILLQRAIEGIKVGEIFDIDIYYINSWGWAFDVEDYYGDIYNDERYFDTPDQAKEQAIQYVMEQEEKG